MKNDGVSIVSVQPHLRFGGSERQSVLLANELNRRNVETAVIEFSSGGGLEAMLERDVTLIDLGMESHALLPVVAGRLYRTLRTLPPSLVILKLWSALLAGFMIERYLPQHRFVYAEDLDPTNHADFTRLGKLKQALIRQIFTRRDAVTANTFAVRDSMMKVYGLTTLPQVISSAVDIETLDRVDPLVVDTPQYNFLASASEGVLRVVSVGSLIPRKGLQVTRDALAGIGFPVRWVILGEGPQLDEIQGWSTESLEICALGGLPRPFDIVREGDLLIHSAWSEAFGIVVLEALGVGTPVICSETIGGREIASRLGKDERLLSTFPVGDVGALRDVVLRAKEALHDRKPLADFRRYIEPYSLAYTADAWIEYARRAFAS